MLVLIFSRAQDAMIDYEDSAVVAVPSQVRPSAEFSSTSALSRLGSILYPPGVHESIFFGPSLAPSERSATQAAIHLAGHIDCNAVMSLGCVHTLLTYVERRRSVRNIHGEEYLQSMVQTVEMFLLHKTMMLSSDTFYSLHIFQDDGPMNAYPGSGKSSSLFKILNLCKTQRGKALMRQWFLMPSNDLSVIQARHEVIKCLDYTANVHFSDQLCQKLRLCGNMRRLMATLRRGKHGTVNGGEWKIVLNFVFQTLLISEVVTQLKEATTVALFTKLLETFDHIQLLAIASLITDAIDFDESEIEELIVIKRFVDEQLNEHKDPFERLEQILTDVRQKIVKDMPLDFAKDAQCVYLPQLGFLIYMPALEPELQSNDTEVLPIWQTNLWEINFSTAQAVYFKDSVTAEL